MTRDEANRIIAEELAEITWWCGLSPDWSEGQRECRPTSMRFDQRRDNQSPCPYPPTDPCRHREKRIPDYFTDAEARARAQRALWANDRVTGIVVAETPEPWPGVARPDKRLYRAVIRMPNADLMPPPQGDPIDALVFAIAQFYAEVPPTVGEISPKADSAT